MALATADGFAQEADDDEAVHLVDEIERYLKGQ
jgi:hypothetical protein